MDRNEVIKTLAEFFFDEFGNDPAAIGEWLASNGQDVDEFHAAVVDIINEKPAA